MAPPASIVIPTRDRPAYLEVTLASVAEQARRCGAELIVVDDGGGSPAVRALAERFGARYVPHERPRGLNVARNSGVAAGGGELVAFLDDDVRTSEGWLAALLAAAREHPEVDVFAGRIVASLEGRAPRSCGREAPPVTTLDLGERDLPTRFAWGANMTVRRTALERVGPFDERLADGGDEQEWQERLRAGAPGTQALYVAAAAVAHRRAGADARLRALARTGYVRGRAARRFDAWRGEAPRAAAELATLARCLGHVIRRRCPAGIVMVAHSAGRLREATRATAPARPCEDDFLTGRSGTVGGLDALRREARDRALDAGELLSGSRLRLALGARRSPPTRSVLVLGVERPEHERRAAAIRAELLRSRHTVELHTRAPDGLGKFENLNLLLDRHRLAAHDWLLVVDDDVGLPRGFLDRFLFLCERFGLTLAQPAHRLRSHAAWEVTRRRPRSLVRETSFVEIGPVTAFARPAFDVLLPFPALRMGWGLDAHWAALARERGWRCGVLDALAISHRHAPAAQEYSREQAIAEARDFLAERPYVRACEAEQTLVTHRRL